MLQMREGGSAVFLHLYADGRSRINKVKSGRVRSDAGRNAMKNKIINSILLLCVLAGIGILSYPFVSNMLHDRKQDEIITEYDEQMAHLGDEEKEQMLEAAREYNEDLIGNVVLSDPFDPAALERINENYDDLLNYEGNGIMGYVEIPRIDVYEAVYHGTSDEVLSRICIIWQINWKTARCTGNLKKMPGRHPKRMAEPVCQLKTRLIQMEKNLRGCMNR